MNFPVLSSLILLPTIGALFLFFTREKEGNNTTIKYVALFTTVVNKATYLAVKLFPSLSLVKNKNKTPTIGNNIKDERMGKFII